MRSETYAGGYHLQTFFKRICKAKKKAKMSTTCDARAKQSLAKLFSQKPARPVSVLIDEARAAVRRALEDACVMERRALLRVTRADYDAYIASLEAVDEACTRLFALEGHLMRARVIAQEADVKAIHEAIRADRTHNKNKFHTPTSQSAALAQRLSEAVPLPPDAVSLYSFKKG